MDATGCTPNESPVSNHLEIDKGTDFEEGVIS